MRNKKRIFLTIIMTLAVAAVMSVCAFAAFDLDVELPAGAVKGDAKWIDSGYEDIDAEGSGWIMIGRTGKDYSGTTEAYPTIATADCGRFYWNKATDKGVYVLTSTNMSANWADWTPIGVANPTAADQKKMYAFASAFVDEMFGYYGSGAYQKALGGDVPANTEASVYVNGSNVGKGKYVVYERWVNAGKASKQWTNFYVTKASYDSFVAKRAELEAAGTTGVPLENALVEFVYANFAGYKMARNVKENGSFVMLTWVWQQLSEAGYVFDTVEFRSKLDGSYFSTFGLAIRALDADTVLFDDAITRLALMETDRGFLYDMDTLTTFAHVDFNDDGTYTGTITDGVIDLRGFDTITPYKTPAQYTSYLLRNSAAIKEVIWFDSILANGEEVAGIIDQVALRDCTALETFTIPASVTLKEIKANAFNGCYYLNVIDVKGIVSPDMTIDSSAFTGASGFTVKVYSEISKTNMEKALSDAGVYATVVLIGDDESEEDEISIPNVITADGFSLRTKSYNGLRALFSYDEDKATAVAAETGYTLVEYGAIAASAANYEKAGSSEALLAAADGKKIQRIVIFCDDGTGINRYVDVDAKQYCISAVNFSGANALKEIYVAGYAIWTDGTNRVVTFSEYVSPRVNKTISLYTLTLEMFKAGMINSQLADEVCVWDVLKYGAFSVTEAETKAPSELLTLTQGYEYDAEGKFTYLDLPLRAWNMYKNASSGKVVWNSRGVTVEDVATTGVLWSVLVDGDNLLVVYREDEAFEGTATLPKLSDSYGVSAPFSEKYFRVTDARYVTEDPTANGLLKTATIYSPIFTDANSAKIKTIVVDYGVDKFDQQSLTSASAATIVYPEGMTSDTYLLSGCTTLKNFTYATADKSYLAAYDVSSLVDLTGLAQVSDYGVAMNAAAVENILLPEADKIKYGQQYGFGGAKALTRVWTVGFDMPEAGVMDLSQTKITYICKGYFNNLDNIDDIYMPDTFKSINAYSMATARQTTDTARWNVFGNNSSETKLNIHVANWDALNVIANTFYEARQNIDYNDGKEGDPNNIAHIVDYLQITYEGVTKTVLEWRADFPAQPDEY